MIDPQIADLVGTWKGTGSGSYPTVDPFTYTETSEFTDIGKPFLVYKQLTTDASDNPSHSESGYWRCGPAGKLEVILAHSNGITELSEGVVSGVGIELESKQLAVSSTAKQVEVIKRTLLLVGDLLTYELRMQAVGQGLEFHLSAELHRVKP